MAEARLKSDVYEMGFGQRVGGGLEFRGLPGSGVIVYQTHDNLQETLFAGGPLGGRRADVRQRRRGILHPRPRRDRRGRKDTRHDGSGSAVSPDSGAD